MHSRNQRLQQKSGQQILLSVSSNVPSTKNPPMLPAYKSWGKLGSELPITRCHILSFFTDTDFLLEKKMLRPRLTVKWKLKENVYSPCNHHQHHNTARTRPSRQSFTLWKQTFSPVSQWHEKNTNTSEFSVLLTINNKKVKTGQHVPLSHARTDGVWKCLHCSLTL